MSKQLLFKSITEVASLISNHEISPTELNEACLAHIEKTDPLVHSFTTIAFDYSRKRAKRATTEIMKGDYRGPLHGIPYTLKDVIATKNVKTTYGNPRGVDYAPRYDATVQRRLERAGGILIGKVYSQIGRGSLPVECYNPWDLRFSPGTSSSGSGASVAGGMGYLSLGTDTGGSVRHPAANCNLVGFRLTTGIISRFGVIHPSWMSDQAGPLCRTVQDCSTVSKILGGYDSNDPISIPYSIPNYDSYLSPTLNGLKIGVPTDKWLWDWESEEVENIVRTAIKCLADLGADLIPIELPRNSEGWDAHFKITLPELACYYEDNFSQSQLEDWPEIAGRITAGKTQPFSDYYHAQQTADSIRQEIRSAFQRVDLIAMPTGASVGVAGDAENVTIRGRKLTTKSKAVHINNMAAMSGCPAISVPCGFTTDFHLPVGLQLMGNQFAEPTVLHAAFAYEQANKWYKEYPNISRSA